MRTSVRVEFAPSVRTRPVSTPSSLSPANTAPTTGTLACVYLSKEPSSKPTTCENLFRAMDALD